MQNPIRQKSFESGFWLAEFWQVLRAGRRVLRLPESSLFPGISLRSTAPWSVPLLLGRAALAGGSPSPASSGGACLPAWAAAKGAPRRDHKEPLQSLAVRKGSFHLLFQHGTNGGQKKSHILE